MQIGNKKRHKEKIIRSCCCTVKKQETELCIESSSNLENRNEKMTIYCLDVQYFSLIFTFKVTFYLPKRVLFYGTCNVHLPQRQLNVGIFRKLQYIVIKNYVK